MFDLPDAKRIRRSDLYTRSSSQSPSPPASEVDAEVERAIQSRLAALYGPIATPPPPPIGTDPKAEIEIEVSPPPAAQEFEFRLFSTTHHHPTSTDPNSNSNSNSNTNTTTANQPATQKITLLDDYPSQEDGGFINPSRPSSYYISLPASAEQKERYSHSALSGSSVLERARQRAWGLEVPWRVKVLRVSRTEYKRLEKAGKQLEDGDGDGVGVAVELEELMGGEKEGKKKKPGKKRRRLLRERKKRREEVQEQRRKEQEAKEEAEREKKTRRNREKKVKRKMKEKAKKAEGVGVEDSTGEAINADAVSE